MECSYLLVAAFEWAVPGFKTSSSYIEIVLLCGCSFQLFLNLADHDGCKMNAL